MGKYKMGPNALINPTIVREMNLPKTIVREMEKKSQRAILFKKECPHVKDGWHVRRVGLGTS